MNRIHIPLSTATYKNWRTFSTLNLRSLDFFGPEINPNITPETPDEELRRKLSHMWDSSWQRFKDGSSLDPLTAPSCSAAPSCSPALKRAYECVTPANILRYIFLGDLASHSVSSRYSMSQVFKNNKIIYNDGYTTKIQKLIYRFRFKLSLDNLKPHEILSNLTENINETPTITQLYHLISCISSTREGCMALATPENDKLLLLIIKRTEDFSQKWHHLPQEILRITNPGSEPIIKKIKFMTTSSNNLGQNMISKGILPGPRLCGKILKSATVRFQLSAIQKYLEILQNLEKPISADLNRALSIFTSQIYAMGINRDQIDTFGPAKFENEQEKIYKKSLELLTGWENDGIPAPGEKRKTSFVSLPHEADTVYNFWNRSYYPAYLCSLVQLNMTRTINYEWESLPKSSRTKYMTCLFAAIYLFAKMPSQALSLINSNYNESFFKESEQAKTPNSETLSHIFFAIYSHLRIKTTKNFRYNLSIVRFQKHPIDLLEGIFQFVFPWQSLKNLSFYSSGKRENGLLIEWVRDARGEVGILLSTDNGKLPLSWRPKKLVKDQLRMAISFGLGTGSISSPRESDLKFYGLLK